MTEFDLDAAVRELDLTAPVEERQVRRGRRVFYVRRVGDRLVVEHRPSRYSVTVRDDGTYTVSRPAGRGCGLTTLERAWPVERAERDVRVEVREAVAVAMEGSR